DRAVRLRLLQLVELADRLAEVDVDRVDLRDRRQQRRLALPDQRAFGDLLLAGAAADRRDDAGVTGIDLRRVDVGLRLLDRGGHCIVQIGLRQQALVGYGTGTLGSDAVVLRGRLRGGEVRQLRVQRGLQRRRVDLEQQLAFLDVGAFGVDALEQHAGDARAHV